MPAVDTPVRRVINMYDAIPVLHALRKQHCTCGRIMIRPDFHENCPYSIEGAKVMPEERKDGEVA